VLTVVAAVSAASKASHTSSGTAQWTIVDLGTLYPAGSSQAVAINDRGEIAGTSFGVGEYPHPVHAFLWRRGTLTDLGTLSGHARSEAVAIDDRGRVAGTSIRADGQQLEGFVWDGRRLIALGVLGIGELSDSEPSAMNGRGDIVGSSSTGSDGYHPFLWDGGRLIDLGTLGVRRAGITAWPKARAINDRRQVVGVSATAGGAVRAYVWQAGRMRSLTLGGESWAAAISERGHVVGGSYTSAARTAQHAFLWKAGRLADLGTLGGSNSDALAVNDRGQVVGWSQTPAGATHAVVWLDGRPRDLGTPGTARSWAAAINERGQIVVNGAASDTCPSGGAFQRGRCGATRVAVWERRRLTKLPTLGGEYTEAVAINERGEIIGASETRDGRTHAVLWTQRA
jgi:probable HAF family extracellular repeat protein